MKRFSRNQRVAKVIIRRISRKRAIKIASKVLECIILGAGFICGMYLLYYLLIFTVFDTFRVPTNSMTPTIQPGYRGIINKLKLGGRYFDVYAAAAFEPVEIKRMPGYGKLEKNDIVVFNASFDKNSDTIVFNMYRYYCKRAIAVAGDTLETHNGFYHVRGYDDFLGDALEQAKLNRLIDRWMMNKPDSVDIPDKMKIAPSDSVFGWTLAEMGPLVIPAEGMEMTLDYRNTVYYRKYIEWETGKKVVWKDSCAFIGNIPAYKYVFKENYFFAAGDHVSNSNDSRYWGLVPEKFIVGVTTIFGHLPWEKKSEKKN